MSAGPVMMQLGLVRFGLRTAAYQSLERSESWRWARQERIGAQDAMQFVGPGGSSVSLSGVLYPGQSGSPLTLDSLRALASLGMPLPLISAGGRVFGLWEIEELSETQTVFAAGGWPRRIEFDLGLARYDGGLRALLPF